MINLNEGKDILEIGIDYMKHAIGLDYKLPYKRKGKLFYRPYRNYFYTAPSTRQAWEHLVFLEYAEEIRKDVFVVTRKGLEYLGKLMRTKIYDLD